MKLPLTSDRTHYPGWPVPPGLRPAHGELPAAPAPASGYGYFPGYLDCIICAGLYGCPFAAPPFGYGTTYGRGNLYCGLYTCGVVQTIQR